MYHTHVPPSPEFRLERLFKPGHHFDAGRVLGVVGCLLQVADRRFVTALEITAGLQLRSIVVDNKDTGGAVIKALLKRRTVMPLAQVGRRGDGESACGCWFRVALCELSAMLCTGGSVELL